MELLCAFVLVLVSSVQCHPYGNGVKSGAVAKAEATAVAGAGGFNGGNIPSSSGAGGASFSSSFSKSAASSQASSSSSSFSFSGSGTVPGFDVNGLFPSNGNACGSSNNCPHQGANTINNKPDIAHNQEGLVAPTNEAVEGAGEETDSNQFNKDGNSCHQGGCKQKEPATCTGSKCNAKTECNTPECNKESPDAYDLIDIHVPVKPNSKSVFPDSTYTNSDQHSKKPGCMSGNCGLTPPNATPEKSHDSGSYHSTYYQNTPNSPDIAPPYLTPKCSSPNCANGISSDKVPFSGNAPQGRPNHDTHTISFPSRPPTSSYENRPSSYNVPIFGPAYAAYSTPAPGSKCGVNGCGNSGVNPPNFSNSVPLNPSFQSNTPMSDLSCSTPNCNPKSIPPHKDIYSDLVIPNGPNQPSNGNCVYGNCHNYPSNGNNPDNVYPNNPKPQGSYQPHSSNGNNVFPNNPKPQGSYQPHSSNGNNVFPNNPKPQGSYQPHSSNGNNPNNIFPNNPKPQGSYQPHPSDGNNPNNVYPNNPIPHGSYQPQSVPVLNCGGQNCAHNQAPHAPKNCGGGNCQGNLTPFSGTVQPSLMTPPSTFVPLKPHVQPSADSKNLPTYTNGFGGPPGILKPNEYSLPSKPIIPLNQNTLSTPSVNYPPNPVPTPGYGSHNQPSSQKNVNHTPNNNYNPNLPPHQPSSHQGSNNAAANAFAGAGAVAYTGSFGGPPGLLKPFDGGKISTAQKQPEVSPHNGPHGKSLNNQGAVNNGGFGGSWAGATASASANAGGYGGSPGYQSGPSGNNVKQGGCSSGCGNKNNFNGNFGLGSDIVNTAGSLAKSVSGALLNGASFGASGSFAGSSASAGAGIKGGYGRR